MPQTEKIKDIQALYERGMPFKFIMQIHDVSRQTISKYAKRNNWSHPRFDRSHRHKAIEKKTKQSIRDNQIARDRLLRRHHQEFQIVRTLLQSAIDHENLERASLARQISETLILLHQSELGQVGQLLGAQQKSAPYLQTQ